MWKLSEIELWQVFRQYTTCQEFGIIFRWQWEVELKTVFRPEVDIWKMYCKIMWRAEYYRQTIRTRKLCTFRLIFIIYIWGTHSWCYAMYILNTQYNKLKMKITIQPTWINCIYSTVTVINTTNSQSYCINISLLFTMCYMFQSSWIIIRQFSWCHSFLNWSLTWIHISNYINVDIVANFFISFCYLIAILVINVKTLKQCFKSLCIIITSKYIERVFE
jgi:hypothetical protein